MLKIRFSKLLVVCGLFALDAVAVGCQGEDVARSSASVADTSSGSSATSASASGEDTGGGNSDSAGETGDATGDTTGTTGGTGDVTATGTATGDTETTTGEPLPCDQNDLDADNVEVNRYDDISDPEDCQITLREAISYANNGAVITFKEPGHTIVLTQKADNITTLKIVKPLTIMGAGKTVLTSKNPGTFLSTSGVVVLQNLEISGIPEQVLSASGKLTLSGSRILNNGSLDNDQNLLAINAGASLYLEKALIQANKTKSWLIFKSLNDGGSDGEFISHSSKFIGNTVKALLYTQSLDNFEMTGSDATQNTANNGFSVTSQQTKLVSNGFVNNFIAGNVVTVRAKAIGAQVEFGQNFIGVNGAQWDLSFYQKQGTTLTVTSLGNNALGAVKSDVQVPWVIAPKNKADKYEKYEGP